MRPAAAALSLIAGVLALGGCGDIPDPGAPRRAPPAPWPSAPPATGLSASGPPASPSPTAPLPRSSLPGSSLPGSSLPGSDRPGLAQREPGALGALVAAPASPVASIVLAAGGDVNLGRECGQAILADPEYDPFAGLGAAWRSADLRFVNLESQLSDQNGVTQSRSNRLIFTGPPGGADTLARAQISAVSTANNHAWDYGRSALLETIANLQRARVPFAGTGRSADAAYRPLVLQVQGYSVALFAVTQIWNQGAFPTHEGRKYVAWADITRLRPYLERARREHDFVLVSYHGGEEYVDAPVDRTRRFVKAVMALGVDAVIGHHPHVPQGIGWVHGRPVVYSLGNFVFAGHDNRPWTKDAFFVRLTLKKGAAAQVAACPVVIDGHRPRTLSSSERSELRRFRQHLLDISTSVGGARLGEPDALGCLPVTPPH